MHKFELLNELEIKGNQQDKTKNVPKSPDKHFDPEKKYYDFSTFSVKGELLDQKEIFECFKSGIILTHCINRTSQNFHNIFKQVVLSGKLEADASLISSKKERTVVEQRSPYILPDLSFYINALAQEITFFIPIQDAIDGHDFYGSFAWDPDVNWSEFHIYPQDQSSVAEYNSYRQSGNRDNLKSFKNECNLMNSILFIVRTSDNKNFTNFLINSIINNDSKIKGFCVVDFDEQGEKLYEKITNKKHFLKSDLLKGWARKNNIELYEGLIENHELFRGKIKRKNFDFCEIHGADAYDRKNNEIFSL